MYVRTTAHVVDVELYIDKNSKARRITILCFLPNMSLESQSHLTFTTTRLRMLGSHYPDAEGVEPDRCYFPLLRISPNAEQMVFTPDIFLAVAKVILETHYKSFNLVKLSAQNPQLIHAEFVAKTPRRSLEGGRLFDDYDQENFEQDVLQPLTARLEKCVASLGSRCH